MCSKSAGVDVPSKGKVFIELRCDVIAELPRP